MNKLDTATTLPETDTIHPRPATQSKSSEWLSVKEAARLLGRSTSTIYRFDRNHGPFRIVIERAHIYIDAASFHAYLAKRREERRNDAPDGPHREPEAVDMHGTVPADSLANPSPHQAPKSGSTAPEDSPRTSFGQRELILPRREQLRVVLYFA